MMGRKLVKAAVVAGSAAAFWLGMMASALADTLMHYHG